MTGIAEGIHETARRLLANGEVGCVIGYEVGPRGRTRPVFVRDVEDVDRLVWDRGCTHNLTTYLREKLHVSKPDAPRPRLAVVVKPCDSRAIHVLLTEGQFTRDQVHIIGVACDGILQGAGSEAVGESGPLQPRCTRCDTRTPLVYDTLIGEPAAAPLGEAAAEDESARLDGMSSSERRAFWLSQFDLCLRCYACRQVCPMCNCPTCLFERDDGLWVGTRIGAGEKRTFQVGRAFHLTGRCVGCDECERVCPVGIPIGLLNRRMAEEVRQRFGYRPGEALAPSPLVTLLQAEEGQR